MLPVLVLLTKRELHSWVFNPVLYVFCALFSFFSLTIMYFLSGFIEANQAELSLSLFRWLPWIFAFIVPVLGIKSWNEEHNHGVFEVMGTQPINVFYLIQAKAISITIIVALSLLTTLPAAITLYWLGQPDSGIIFTGYLGSFFCGSSFALISLAVAAFMRGSVGAYICSVACCILLLVLGLNKIADVLLATFPNFDLLVGLISSISITQKFEPFNQGRIEISAVLGFVIYLATAILVCHKALMSQRGSQNKTDIKHSFSYGVPVSISILICILLLTIARFIPGKIDLTQSKRFDIPTSVEHSLKTLASSVTVRVFVTKQHPLFGYDSAQYLEQITQHISQLESLSNGKIQIEVMDPNTDPAAARIAEIDEIQQFDSEHSQPYVFGMMIESIHNKFAINNIKANKNPYFFAHLTQTILNVAHKNKKIVAVITPFDQNRTDPLIAENWSPIVLLNNTYQLIYSQQNEPLPEADVIILMQLQPLNEKMEQALKAFIKTGGDVIALVDPLSIITETFADNNSIELSTSRLPEFIEQRGISLATDQVVYDSALATLNTTQTGEQLDPSILTLTSQQFNQMHPITAGFDYAHFLYVGGLTTTPTKEYQTIELLKTSNQSSLINKQLAKPQNTKRPASKELNNNRTRQAIALLQQHKTDSTQGRVIVISDIDWLHAAIAGSKHQGNQIAKNANIQLMQNTLNYLTGNTALRDLRSQTLAKRSLEKWEHIVQSIKQTYQPTLTALSKKIDKSENELRTLLESRNFNNQLSQSQTMIEQKIKETKQQITKYQTEIIGNKDNREKQINLYLNTIKWLNVLCFPVFLTCFGYLVCTRRQKLTQGSLNANV